VACLDSLCDEPGVNALVRECRCEKLEIIRLLKVQCGIMGDIGDIMGYIMEEHHGEIFGF